jgi:hypothetical protein
MEGYEGVALQRLQFLTLALGESGQGYLPAPLTLG